MRTSDLGNMSHNALLLLPCPSTTEAVSRQPAVGVAQPHKKDGRKNLLLSFRIQDTGIQCGDTSASLTGKTLGGQAIDGADFIQAVNCTFNDDFNDDFLNPNLWSVEIPPLDFSGTVSETHHRLEITLGPGAGGTGIVSTCSLTGDFDVQADYLLINWPLHNGGHSLMLRAIDFGPGQFGGAISIGRFSGTQESYVAAFLDHVFETSTTDTAGKLRLVRTGATMAGYFQKGKKWVLVGSRSSPVGPTHISIELGTSDPAGIGGVKAAFDNFKVNAGTVQCP